MAVSQQSTSFVVSQAIEPASHKFPTQRISIQRGIYEYLCTFLLTTVILGGLMIAGPTGVEAFIAKLFKSNPVLTQPIETISTHS